MSKPVASASVIVTNVVGIKQQLKDDQSFLVAAQDFHEAAKLLLSDPLSAPVRAMAFLCGQATECYLKALLTNDGMAVDVLRKKPYGHDLEKLWSEAHSKGLLSYAPGWLRQLNLVHDFPYQGRYPMGRNIQVYPDYQPMMAELRALRDLVMDKVPLVDEPNP